MPLRAGARPRPGSRAARRGRFRGCRRRAHPRARPGRTTSAAAARSTSAPTSGSTRRTSSSWSRALSSPVYELLKRPDELFVVEHALSPRFVEDSVRLMVKGALEAYGALEDELRPRPPGQLRDDPQPRRPRRALRHGRRAARRAGKRRPLRPPHRAGRLAPRRAQSKYQPVTWTDRGPWGRACCHEPASFLARRPPIPSDTVLLGSPQTRFERRGGVGGDGFEPERPRRGR